MRAPSAPRGRVDHWESIYRTRREHELSWRQRRPSPSLRLIARFSRPTDRIVDVGGGTSRLAEWLWGIGYRNLTVVDISREAIARARARRSAGSTGIRWRSADLAKVCRLSKCELWHDRAMFHFLVRPTERRSYLKNLDQALTPGGTVVMATFAPDGPESCSGLPVERYSPTRLARVFGRRYRLVAHQRVLHRTPWGSVQPFTFGVLRKTRPDPSRPPRASARRSRKVRARSPSRR